MGGVCINENKKCYVVSYDEVGCDFWVSEKIFEERDSEYIGTMIFFDKDEAMVVAQRMNGG